MAAQGATGQGPHPITCNWGLVVGFSAFLGVRTACRVLQSHAHELPKRGVERFLATCRSGRPRLAHIGDDDRGGGQLHCFHVGGTAIAVLVWLSPMAEKVPYPFSSCSNGAAEDRRLHLHLSKSGSTGGFDSIPWRSPSALFSTICMLLLRFAQTATVATRLKLAALFAPAGF